MFHICTTNFHESLSYEAYKISTLNILICRWSYSSSYLHVDDDTKGYNYVKTVVEVMLLVLCILSDDVLYLNQVS